MGSRFGRGVASKLSPIVKLFAPSLLLPLSASRKQPINLPLWLWCPRTSPLASHLAGGLHLSVLMSTAFLGGLELMDQPPLSMPKLGCCKENGAAGQGHIPLLLQSELRRYLSTVRKEPSTCRFKVFDLTPSAEGCVGAPATETQRVL